MFHCSTVPLFPARYLLNLSPLQRDVIRMVAFMAMVGDHIATAFQLDMPLLNLLGRCAFPLFALVSGCNLAGHCLRQSSLNRLWLMALLAQLSSAQLSSARVWVSILGGGGSVVDQ
ncbi:conjugal transfer protein TraX [Yersinia enterocolitica]|nr:conjugal transfer protein TraX [Yersinia enterocolitica]EKN3665667.1 conjugal transfer protein TraX [Yersinia enterocolitica]EKN3846196.1 conjugal transfer protein TraX [Yersinia enterocolitica]EKN6123887.1 conjugal transfer protein TraX [Yersinia enterocolitica]ELI7953250.1 conjugal transfer protein TraX [Yersinia enterocolitica]